MNPVEVALVAFRDALDAAALARLRLEEKVRDAFPAERAMVAHSEALLPAAKNELAAAIGANGPLRAEDSQVGFASFTSAERHQYAEPAAWRQVLTTAGLQAYLPGIIIESVNGRAVDELCKTSGAFHLAVEKLITTKLSAPVLRYGFKKEGANADRT